MVCQLYPNKAKQRANKGEGIKLFWDQRLGPERNLTD